MEEIKKKMQEDIQEKITEKKEEIKTEEKIDEKGLSEKEKKYQEILEKKANKKRLSVEDKIFLKEIELTSLRTTLSEQTRKEKSAWTKKIFRMLKPELERLYDKENENLDLKIISLLIKNLENFEELSASVNIEEYFVKNKKDKMIRIKKEM